jgi:GNAT superfamily N-acetyltransferase
MEIAVAPTMVDWTALLALQQAAFAFMDGRIDPPSSLDSMTPADFAQKAAKETLIVATLDDTLVGCIFCNPHDQWLYVSKMAVAPHLQGQGIGRDLMDTAKALAAEKDLLGLELETRIELTENHETFTRLGFTKVADLSHPGYAKVTSIRMRWTSEPAVIESPGSTKPN